MYTTSPLVQAVRNRNTKQVHDILRGKGVSQAELDRALQNLRNFDNPSREVARMLLENGANPNRGLGSTLGTVFTYLHRAAMAGDRATVELLLSFGANPNDFMYDSGCMTLDDPIDNHYRWQTSALYSTMNRLGESERGFAIASLLISHGANVNNNDNQTGPGRSIPRETVLHLAIRRGQKEAVNFLLSEGADPNQADLSGMTPLSCACQYCEPSTMDSIFEILLSHGADVNAMGRKGTTVLLEELHRRDKYRIEIVKKLIAIGADPNVSCSGHLYLDGYYHPKTMPLWIAISQCDTDLVKLLLDSGCRVQDAGPNLMGGLLYSICGMEGAAAIFKMVLENMDRDIRAESTFYQLHSMLNGQYGLHKDTLLHHASQAGDMDIVSLLIRNGADATIKDKYSMTVVHSIIFSEHEKCLDLLVSLVKGVKQKKGRQCRSIGEVVNQVDRYGQTALHYAAKSNSNDVPAIIRLLVENGARIDTLDNRGRTSLMMAAVDKGTHLPVIRQLLELA